MDTECKHCGTKNPPVAKFCSHCGRPTAATSVDRTVVMSPTSVAAQQGPLDAKTILQKVQQTFGQDAFVPTGKTALAGNPAQRELTIMLTDYSGSMEDEYEPGITKLQAAIRAAINMILEKNRLDCHDEIGLAAFDDKGKELMSLHPLSSHRREMIRTQQSLEINGGTDINEGLLLARDMLDWGRTNVVRRIVLLTDGQGGEPLETARELKARGVVIDVIGIGDDPANVDEKLLRQVASVVGGENRYRFIRDHRALLAHYTQLANKTAII
jgi:Mg-chelatase subunit ChlD